MRCMNSLLLQRCPHCGVARPMLAECRLDLPVKAHAEWRVFQCSACGGIVSCKWVLDVNGRPIGDAIAFPRPRVVSDAIPAPAKRYLEQAQRTLGDSHDAAVMVAASAVDAMLKAKGHGDGHLHSRIDAAIDAGLLTKDMGSWAHAVRHVSNDPRHADEDNPHVTMDDARLMVDFVEALGQVLFVLPRRAKEAIESAKAQNQ